MYSKCIIPQRLLTAITIQLTAIVRDNNRRRIELMTNYRITLAVESFQLRITDTIDTYDVFNDIFRSQGLNRLKFSPIKNFSIMNIM